MRVWFIKAQIIRGIGSQISFENGVFLLTVKL